MGASAQDPQQRGGPADGGDPLAEARRAAHVQKVRAERLEQDLALAERRLREAEQAGAGGEALLLARERELSDLRAELALPSARITAPLRRIEPPLGWVLRQAAKLAGRIARHLLFRAGPRR